MYVCYLFILIIFIIIITNLQIKTIEKVYGMLKVSVDLSGFKSVFSNWWSMDLKYSIKTSRLISISKNILKKKEDFYYYI